MSNEKHYPLHPNQSHPPIMTCEIQLEEYESLKREIAELQKQVHDYAQGLYVIQAKAEKEARHDKHKRCLAMAMWCMARYNEWVAYYPTTTTRKMKFLDKWEKRWRELAEIFNEGV